MIIDRLTCAARSSSPRSRNSPNPRWSRELAARAEARGWDGFFVWDHIEYRDPVRLVADPWITLAAIAVATERVIIGPMVTPLARRRPHQLARETVTLDRLSGGRLVLGVGLGSARTPEFDPARFGEEGDARERAKLLDDGLARLLDYWDGDFEPRPVSKIPIWVAARWPNRRPLKRAARYDGVFPIDMPGPDVLAEYVGGLGLADVIVTNRSGRRPCTVGPGRRHLVPDRLRPDPDRGRGPGRDRCALGEQLGDLRQCVDHAVEQRREHDAPQRDAPERIGQHRSAPFLCGHRGLPLALEAATGLFGRLHVAVGHRPDQRLAMKPTTSTPTMMYSDSVYRSAPDLPAAVWRRRSR